MSPETHIPLQVHLQLVDSNGEEPVPILYCYINLPGDIGSAILRTFQYVKRVEVLVVVSNRSVEDG